MSTCYLYILTSQIQIRSGQLIYPNYATVPVSHARHSLKIILLLAELVVRMSINYIDANRRWSYQWLAGQILNMVKIDDNKFRNCLQLLQEGGARKCIVQGS